MPKPQSPTADLIKVESSLQIFPRSPVQISDPTIWQDIFLAHHRQPTWEMPENHLAQHVLSVNIGAARQIERVIDGQIQREQFLSRNFAIYPADMDYVLRWKQESEFLLVGIDPVLLTRTAEAIGQNSIELIPLLSTQDSLIHSLAMSLKAELESSQVGGRLYVESIAQTLAIHLLRNYTTHQIPIATPNAHGLSKHKLQQATDFIHDFLDRDLSLSELAAIAQMSPFHFAHQFKKSTGLAPHQFLIRCRIERAKELLLCSELSIADIAAEVGFANQSHMTRHFKRVTGVTPGAVLKNRKNRQCPTRT